ncbi:MAG: ATP-binding protein, partial [Nitrospinaceae bacterium]
EGDLIGSPVSVIVERRILFDGVEGKVPDEEKLFPNREETFLSKNGKKIPVLFAGSLIHGSEAQSQGYILAAHDLREFKQAEEKIKNLSKFPDENPGPVLRISKYGELLYGNQASSLLTNKWNTKIGQTVPLPWQSLIAEVVSSKSKKAVDVIVNDRHYLMMLAYVKEADYVNVYGVDITERKLAEEKLKHYSAELERSNKDLEEFAYLASHDLQEPLRKIITFGDRLKDKSADMDEAEMDYLDRMQKAAGRMKQFIEDLLEYSRVAQVQKPLERIDFKKLIDEVLVDLELQIKNKGATVHVGELPTLEADSGQLQTLFQNLISNALKYHREDVAPVVNVTSSYCEETNRWQIEIADNGIGIDEKYFKRIFKPFERLHGRSAYEGTGIGLAICEKIVRRHQGEISVRSVPQNGTTFTVFLPEKQPARG